MLPGDDVVEELTRTVFETVVGRTATRDESHPSTHAAYSVDVSGPWSGRISIAVGDRLANLVAGAMFESEAPEPEDVRDAMCELANVIGGNLKGLMPGPSELSVPCVTDHDRAPVLLGESQLLFSCHGEPFSVTVRVHQTEKHSP